MSLKINNEINDGWSAYYPNEIKGINTKYIDIEECPGVVDSNPLDTSIDDEYNFVNEEEIGFKNEGEGAAASKEEICVNIEYKLKYFV